MTTEQVIKVYELFFPGIPMSTRMTPDYIKVEYVTGSKKYLVNYTIEEDHLEVYTVDLNEDLLVETIIEGSPKDIIKLAKLLQ